MTQLQQGDALLIVDMQNDFLPGGALGVTGGDEIVCIVNAYARQFTQRGLPVVFSRDWHPAKHCSFKEQGGPWPLHCVAESTGAQFAPGLTMPGSAHIVSKATQPDADAYSAFQNTGLTEYLRARGVRRLFVCGLATDYCVRASTFDAVDAGFDVVVLADAVRAVNVHPGDGAAALDEMRSRGAQVGTL